LFENLRRYSQVGVNNTSGKLPTSVNDTSGKFAAGVNYAGVAGDTGGK
jgi:hypothetical protein